MNTPQITLTNCLTEVNNALNFWYPVKRSDVEHGASQAEHDARHVRLFQFRDRLQKQLMAAGKDADFDLAMAMAELANVAKERDSYKSGRADLAAVLATYAAERDKLKAERDSANWSLSRAKESLRAAEQEVVEVEEASFDLRTVNARLVADLAAAMRRADTAEAILRARA